jgi:hypothetical protein
MVKSDEKNAQKMEKTKQERQVEVRIEGADAASQQKQEIVIEEPQQTQELRVQVPSEYELSSEEMTRIAKESANKLLDTMKGTLAAVRSIIARIQTSTRVSSVQRISRITEITEIWRG